MPIVSMDWCKSSGSSQIPNCVGPTHSPTHHFRSLITGTCLDCCYHVDDDTLGNKGGCGPSSFSVQLITQKQCNCHYCLLWGIIMPYFSNLSTWRALKLWQWGGTSLIELLLMNLQSDPLHFTRMCLPPLLVVLSAAWVEWEMLLIHN